MNEKSAEIGARDGGFRNSKILLKGGLGHEYSFLRQVSLLSASRALRLRDLKLI